MAEAFRLSWARHARLLSYHVDATVASVFDCFKDPTSDAAVGGEVVEAKMTKEGIGTYLHWRMKLAGVPVYEGFEVITDLVPNKHITEKSSRALVGTWDYSFEPDRGRWKVTMEHRPRSLWVLPPLSNLVDLTTTRLSKTYIGRVRPKLEGEAGGACSAPEEGGKPKKPAGRCDRLPRRRRRLSASRRPQRTTAPENMSPAVDPTARSWEDASRNVLTSHPS